MSESLRQNPRRLNPGSLDYSVCTQFLFMHVACLLAFWTGVSAAAVAVCLALYVVRMFAITAGFHRLFSHRSYKTGRVFQFLMAFVGTAAYQKGPLWWAAHHRRHHLTSTPKRTCTRRSRAACGSRTSAGSCRRESQATDRELISNLLKYRELRWLDQYYVLPPAAAGGSTFLLGARCSAATTPARALRAGRCWSGVSSSARCCSTTARSRSTRWRTSSAAAASRPTDNSRNNLLVALITLGEGWHNNHHHYPSSERQGFYWWEIDMSRTTRSARSRGWASCGTCGRRRRTSLPRSSARRRTSR